MDEVPTTPSPGPIEDDAWFQRVGEAIAPIPGGKLADLEVLGEIASGGQGRVYRARQRGTQRVVAVKRLREGALATPEATARFRREVELASGVRHPGVVTIHEIAYDGDAPVIIMEYVDGGPIDAWADGVRASADGLRRVVRVMGLVSEAVAAAHGKGVLHRDLKPANILVDAKEQPRILDFGLARPLLGESMTLTQDGGFVGTPTYAPPEQLDGRLSDLDVRADVYALGAVLYRVVTGRPAFEHTGGVTGLVDAIRAGAVARAERVNPAVDADLGSIIVKAMAPDREVRYATVAALAEDLGRWARGDAVLARPPSVAYVASRFVRRHRAGVSLTAGALVMIVVGGVSAGVLAVQLSHKESVLGRTVGELQASLEAEKRAAADAERSRGRAEREMLSQRAAITSMMSAMVDLHDAEHAGRTLTVAEAIDRRVAFLDGGTMRMRPDAEAAIRLGLGVLDEQLQRRPEAKVQFEKAIVLFEADGQSLWHLSEAHAQLGNLAMEEGDYPEAAARFRKAVDLVLGDPVGITDVSYRRLKLVGALIKLHDWGEAQRVAEAATGLDPFMEKERQRLFTQIAAGRASSPP